MQEKLQILTKALGRSWSSGDEYLFRCPKCDHHKLKLSINFKRDAFKCWICDYSGNKISRLIYKFAHDHYSDWLSASGAVDIGKYDSLFGSTQISTTPSVILPEGFKTLTGPKTVLKHKSLDYLYSRSLSDLDILRWKIGYCDYGEYEGRVIVPSFDTTGKLNYFIARSYNGNSYKYKNPKVSKDLIFNDLNIDWTDDILLVEGVFDAIKCKNSIPLLGSSLKETSKIFQKICLEKPNIFLALDADAKEKELRIAEKLMEYGIKVWTIKIQPYSDVGEMSSEEIIKRKLNADFVSDMDYLKYKLNF